MTINDQVKAAEEWTEERCRSGVGTHWTQQDAIDAHLAGQRLCREDAQRREEEALIFGALWHVRGGCCNYDWHKKITTEFRSRKEQEGE